MGSDDQEVTFDFTSTYEGNYRFEIEDDNAQAEYVLKITDSIGNILKDTNISADVGKTVSFDSSTRYSITLKQFSGYANYRMKIYCPDDTIEISTPNITGEIYYKDQINTYKYVPIVSGVYRFDISDDVADTEYRFVLSDSRGKILKDTYLYYGKGATVELEQNENYLIKLEQYSGFANYELRLGIPKEIQQITSNSFGGSITYTDQQDRYTYNAPATGEYIFLLTDDNNDASYRFIVKDPRGKTIKDLYISSNDEKAVDLEGGTTYTIEIRYYSEFANYIVNISY